MAGYRDWEFVGFGWRSGDTLITADIPNTLPAEPDEPGEEEPAPRSRAPKAGLKESAGH